MLRFYAEYERHVRANPSMLGLLLDAHTDTDEDRRDILDAWLHLDALHQKLSTPPKE